MQRSLEVEKRTRRWREQRWLLDSVIKTIGPEWDQARVQSKGSRGGPQGLADFRRAGSRMNKFNDIGPQFGKVHTQGPGLEKRALDHSNALQQRHGGFCQLRLLSRPASQLFATGAVPYHREPRTDGSHLLLDGSDGNAGRSSHDGIPQGIRR